MAHLLTMEEVLDIHYELVKMFDQEDDPIVPSGPRDANLLSSACMRPNTRLGGVNKYASLEAKIAALFHSLVKNHPFHNGNKRTALVSLITALHRNKRRFKPDVTDDEIYEMVTSVAGNNFPFPDNQLNHDQVVQELSIWIRRKSAFINSRASEMKTREFLQKCESIGASWRKSGPSFLIMHKDKNIHISRSTRKISGRAIRRYIGILELSERAIGVIFEEFQEGINPEQTEIRRFRNVLRRLAHS